MTLNELQFVDEYARHGNGTKAVLAVWPDLPLGTASSRADAMLKNSTIAEAIELKIAHAAKFQSFTRSVLTHEEKRQMLAFRLTATPDELEGTPFVESESYDENGTLRKRTFTSWSSALEADNKMAGHNAPEQMEIGAKGGVAALMLAITGQAPKVIEAETSQAEPFDFGV